MKRFCLLVALTTVVGGCVKPVMPAHQQPANLQPVVPAYQQPANLSQEPANLQSVAMTEKIRVGAETAVRSELKDPESARFGPMSAFNGVAVSGSIVVCGSVNAKNGCGGYAGAVPYLARLMPITTTGAAKYIGTANLSTPSQPGAFYSVFPICAPR
jgi:hypothetical protein